MDNIQSGGGSGQYKNCITEKEHVGTCETTAFFAERVYTGLMGDKVGRWDYIVRMNTRKGVYV